MTYNCYQLLLWTPSIENGSATHIRALLLHNTTPKRLVCEAWKMPLPEVKV